MPRLHLTLAALSVTARFALVAVARTTPAVPTPAGVAPITAPPAVTAPAPKLTTEEAAAEREKYVKEVRALIVGHEKEPAEKVFKDIKILKGVPAGRLLAIMNFGYGRSLGVSCTHCHTAGEWDKSDKPQKEIAREMSRLSKAINTDLLPKIANLDSKKPVVNCTTCHRGEVKPALDLPEAPPPRSAAH